MRKTTHVVGGITAGIAVNKFVVPMISKSASVEDVLCWGAVMGGAFIGSVLPDIDHPGSYIGRRMKPISFILHHTVGHRGMTHSPIFAILMNMLLCIFLLHFTSGFVQLVMLMFVLGLFSGMVSHLILDAMTKGGIPLLYPLSKKDFSFAPFKTGGIGEYIASLLCIVIIFLMIRSSLPLAT